MTFSDRPPPRLRSSVSWSLQMPRPFCFWVLPFIPFCSPLPTPVIHVTSLSLSLGSGSYQLLREASLTHSSLKWTKHPHFLYLTTLVLAQPHILEVCCLCICCLLSACSPPPPGCKQEEPGHLIPHCALHPSPSRVPGSHRFAQ